jgi:hypothetical protein
MIRVTHHLFDGCSCVFRSRWEAAKLQSQPSLLSHLCPMIKNTTFQLYQKGSAAPSVFQSGGIEIEENWDKVKTIFLPTEKQMTPDVCAPLIAMLPLEVISHASLWFPIMPFVLFPMSLNLLLLAFSSSRLTVQYSSSV